jgi:hypothetical protein
MATTNLAQRIAGLRALIDPINRFLEESFYAELVGKPGVSDFALGNPHEMPLPGFEAALRQARERSPEPQGVAMAID